MFRKGIKNSGKKAAAPASMGHRGSPPALRHQRNPEGILAAHGHVIASMALSLAAIFSIGTCRFLLHQPEEPRELEDLIKKHENQIL